MSSNKLKTDLEKKLERQKAALQATKDQLDWIEQVEKGSKTPNPK